MKKLTQRGRRLAIGAAGIALILAPLTAVMGAAPAAAAPAALSVSCIRTGFLPTSINGVTYNQSNVALTRTFTEKGVTNSWHPEPAARIERPSEGRTATTDQWCVNAQFGSAMKVGYKTPDGTTVTFAADQYVLQNPNASCSVSGPSAGQLTCRNSHLQVHLRRLVRDLRRGRQRRCRQPSASGDHDQLRLLAGQRARWGLGDG